MREFVITAGSQAMTLGATNPLIVFNPASAANVNIETLRYWVGQWANATSAQQRVFMQTIGSSFPTTATVTPNKLKSADPNASVLVGTTYISFGGVGIQATSNNTGATTVVHEDTFNVLNGWLHVPTPPETRIIPAPSVSSGQPAFEFCLGTTLTNSSWSYGLTYREV